METHNVVMPDATDTGKFGFHSNQNPSASETKPSGYPNDLVHGFLAAHCADGAGTNTRKSKLKPGDSVVFSPDNKLYVRFKEDGVDLNKHLSGWSVQQIIEDHQTEYLGVIYVNELEHQIVLAHRSTCASLELTADLLKQSGVQSDIEGILMGRIVTHQAYAYLATKRAVDYAVDSGFILSITGHSLGAWLAALSVFYCNTDMNYKNVRGITFDGPGPFEMMEQMSASDIRGSGASFKANELDIVSYLSAPNIVNSANKHIGMVYRIFPEIERPNDENWDWLVYARGERKQMLSYQPGHIN